MGEGHLRLPVRCADRWIRPGTQTQSAGRLGHVELTRQRGAARSGRGDAGPSNGDRNAATLGPQGGTLSSSSGTPPMGKSKRSAQLQGNTLDVYTTLAPSVQRETCLTGCRTDAGLDAPFVEPTKAELLAAIHGSREALEGKIELVGIEVNLLWAGIQKVSDRVQIMEGSISEQRLTYSGRTVVVVAEWRGESDQDEIQEDGTMALTRQDVTIDSMKMAVADEAEVVGT
ncbi:hypothetical protein NDU88_004510 [Pleurodeles waltl]|uniref:Uncharacterized protein n=1 Tax=Pleurodeles waltl TaxID=8319 RepID=A0AAV7WVA8_PLEWA|nr:hypothetical protein NDU88_004510 [Pleurodeles waltl]